MPAKVPTAAQIRQTFLDFFKSKDHTIVPSDNVGYTSRDGARIFTNAGMNQFVPIFLGEREPDVDTWPGVLSKALPTRAADTQKCIRAGGKHNDLEDVGLDTYHHTFFEMLGNWSFGDYFKKEAIAWSWELIVEKFKFPPSRVYATIYQPDEGDPAQRDQESWEVWAEKFRAVGLDPEIHIVNGNKKDNFWMMADTGPCGPCTEMHVDLTPGPVELDEDRQRQGAKLVNGDSADCIEIWNNVFIQYNANPDGSFSSLPAKHVDTGMGFERLCSIIQGTQNFADFENARISNYDTDVFKPIFDELTKLCGKHYKSTLPKDGSTGETEQEKIDVAFRVIADHVRTLSFAIADGIQPGNSDRNYTLRRILRRAVKYGRTLGFTEPFFYKLVDALEAQMGGVFPELNAKKEQIKKVLKLEEEAFNRTLDRGMALFEGEAGKAKNLSGSFAFQLYDTYGFPLDLTELLARERGLSVDTEGFEKLMTEQRERARAAMKKNVISVSEIETKEATEFVGYDSLETEATILEVVGMGDKTAVVLDTSVCYAEMGGQVGDTGELHIGANAVPVIDTTKVGNTWLHFIRPDDSSFVIQDSSLTLRVDPDRRHAIERHHTVTHILHWALHEVVSADATQKGSAVGPEKLTFDFNSGALTPQQLADIEKLVNERVIENDAVSWTEVAYQDVQGRDDVMQLFGEKYPEQVRVVQIGGEQAALDGYSMELCGGTHTRFTGEIGLFRLLSEGAVAAGVRRIEAIAGIEAYEAAHSDAELLKLLCGMTLSQSSADLEKRIDVLLSQQKELEKALKAAQQREAAGRAKDLVASAENDAIVANLGEVDGDYAMALSTALKSEFDGVVVLAATGGGSVTLIATVAKSHQDKHKAGNIIKAIAPIVGGRGGGKPDFARGGGKDASKVDEALAEARKLVG
jgi:alanyl-tRNA synthetase